MVSAVSTDLKQELHGKQSGTTWRMKHS